jgi:hypothetical protein
MSPDVTFGIRIIYLGASAMCGVHVACQGPDVSLNGACKCGRSEGWTADETMCCIAIPIKKQWLAGAAMTRVQAGSLVMCILR